MNILGKYKIEYPEKGIIQQKNLIEHEVYTAEIIPILDQINEIERKYPKKKADKLIKPLKSGMKAEYGEAWFTDQSPLFYAIEKGFIDLGINQGGIIKVVITLSV